MLKLPFKRIGKRGQIQQIAFFLILIFSVIFTLLISKIVLDNFNAALVKMDADAVVLAEMKASINAVNAKLDADAGVTDVDFASLHDVAGVVSSDYVSTLDVAE